MAVFVWKANKKKSKAKEIDFSTFITWIFGLGKDKQLKATLKNLRQGLGNVARVTYMRTSVDIPDELMKKAKIKAVEEEISLKELIIRGLKNELGDLEEKNETPCKDLKGRGTTSWLNPGDSGCEG